MALYSYRCSSCGNRFDNFVPMERRNVLQECPKCHEHKGIRQIETKIFDSGGTNAQKLGRLDDYNRYKK